jgi:exopolyphosphatase/guanosine-5'-triphosphate,3'-diphosphate pyrophosphatase
MTSRGVGSGREPEPGTLILDIGGGSTELIVDDFHASLELGSVRHTERFLHFDPPEPRELADCAGSVRSLLAEHVPDDVRARVAGAIGVAGTLTTLAALDLELDAYDRERVHGHRLTRDGARAQLERLASLPVSERRELPAMEPERAPVIVAGAIILVEVLDYLRLDAIEVSERDILDGAAFAAAELPAPDEGAAPPGAYTCC